MLSDGDGLMGITIEDYASDHNLEFSTDTVPSKSKSKCIYFCGRLNRVKYPDPVKLAGKELPWVVNAEHLGHTLSQQVNMDKDCQRAKSKFIAKSSEVREQLKFAHPLDVLRVVQVMCMDAYGSMLWNLASPTAEQFYKSWNTCVKIVYDVPRNTFTYLVEGFLAASLVPMRNQLLSRYAGFVRKLLSSASREVRGLAKLVMNDPRSTTCTNLRLLRLKSGIREPQKFASHIVREKLPIMYVPKEETWRLGLLEALLKIKSEKFMCGEDMQAITAQITSLSKHFYIL